MRIITLVNPKGGSGKTTLAINLASILAARGARTLLLDLDPIGDCAPGLAVPQNRVEYTAIDLLEPDRHPGETPADWVWQITRRLDLLPSTEVLATWADDGRDAHCEDPRLRFRLNQVADRYEYCVIDTPPALGRLTWLALQAGHEWLFPVDCDYLGLHGVVKQMPLLLAMANQLAHETRISIVANAFDPQSRLSREILAALKTEMGDRVLPMAIERHESIREAQGFGQPICEYQPNGQAHRELEQLTDSIIRPPQPEAQVSEEQPQPRKAVSRPPLSRAAELAQRARELALRHGSEAMKERLRRAQNGSADTPAPASTTAENTPAQAQPARQPSLDPVSPGRSDTRPTSQDREPAGQGCLLEMPQPQNVSTSPFTTRFTRLFGVRETARGLLFIQPDRLSDKPIQLVGNFSEDGSEQTVEMQHDRQLGIWQTLLPVKPGRYCYQLLIDGQAIPDPHNQHVEMLAEKGSASVVEVKGVGVA